MSDPCRDCNGTGGFEGTPASQCPSCGKWLPSCCTPDGDILPPDNQREQEYDAARNWYDFKPPNEALDHNPKSNDHESSSRDMEPVYATLHFYYNDPDSMRRFRLCNQAEDMKLALWEFDNKLRAFAKYGVEHTIYAEQEPADVIRMVRELFHSYLNDYGIDLTEE